MAASLPVMVNRYMKWIEVFFILDIQFLLDGKYTGINDHSAFLGSCCHLNGLFPWKRTTYWVRAKWRHLDMANRLSEEEQDLHHMKSAAAEFYRLNRVPQELERALNQLFIHRPEDIHGYLVGYIPAETGSTTRTAQLMLMLTLATFTHSNSRFPHLAATLLTAQTHGYRLVTRGRSSRRTRAVRRAQAPRKCAGLWWKYSCWPNGGTTLPFGCQARKHLFPLTYMRLHGERVVCKSLDNFF